MVNRNIDKKVYGKLIHTYVYGGSTEKSDDYIENIERGNAKNLIDTVSEHFENEENIKDKYFAIWKIEYVVFKINGNNRKLFNKKMLLRKESYIVEQVSEILGVNLNNYLVQERNFDENQEDNNNNNNNNNDKG